MFLIQFIFISRPWILFPGDSSEYCFPIFFMAYQMATFKMFPNQNSVCIFVSFMLLPISLLPHSLEQPQWCMWNFLYNILHFQIVFFLGQNTFLNILFCTLCSSFRIRNPISKPWIYKACSIQELVCLSFWDVCFFCEQVKCRTMDVRSFCVFSNPPCPPPTSFIGNQACLKLLIHILNLHFFPLLFQTLCVSFTKNPHFTHKVCTIVKLFCAIYFLCYWISKCLFKMCLFMHNH